MAVPATPFHFCVRYVRRYLPIVCVMVVLEGGQSACSILLPYAIKQIMEGVTAAQAAQVAPSARND